MTQAQFYAALRTLGMRVAYGAFDKPTKPPFICYLFTANADLMADDCNYVPIEGFRVELYTPDKDPVREAAVEALLKSLRLPYSKSEAPIESEDMRQVAYEIQLV